MTTTPDVLVIHKIIPIPTTPLDSITLTNLHRSLAAATTDILSEAYQLNRLDIIANGDLRVHIEGAGLQVTFAPKETTA